MESLGSVLQRVVSPRRTSGSESSETLTSAQPDSAVVEDRCLICRGIGWVHRKVPLGHPDFGEMFRCRCVAEQDAAEMAARRLAASGLPHPEKPRYFADFKVDDATVRAFKAAQDYCDPDSYVRCLTYTGDWGNGKSHLLEASGGSSWQRARRSGMRCAPTC